MSGYIIYFVLALAAVARAQSSSIPPITWVKCPCGTPTGVDCGKIDVPLTYKSGSSIEPADDRTVTLRLTRHRAAGNTTLRGPLFVNPGGPGAPARPGVEATGEFRQEVRDMYDFVGLDPRGVGTSTPVRCDPKIFNRRLRTLVDSEQSYEALKQYGKELGESCAALTGPLINYLDTIHVAKDHEVVRRALGAKQFDFLGLSYGSMIGTTYLELFPEAAGRMVFDGIVDHSQSEISTLFAEATTFEATLNEFFRQCDSQDACPLKIGTNNSKATFEALIRDTRSSPIPAPDCTDTCRSNVTFQELMTSVQGGLIAAEAWGDLATNLALAAAGNASALSVRLATSETPEPRNESPYASIAIGCQDWKHSAGSWQDLAQRLAVVEPFTPLTRGVTQSWYYQAACIGWPTRTTFPQQSLDKAMVERAPPVLLVNSVYDPSTSIVWANGVRDQLPMAVSVTRNGSGHTSHGLDGETRDAMDFFFATGQLPPDGSVYQS